MPRIRKKTSKRTTTHQREKFKHKVAEGRKKKKKLAKKNPQWKSKQKKDPGVPNNFPFKDQVLAEVAEARRKAAEDKQLRKEQAKKAKAGLTAAPTEGESSADEYDDAPTEEQDAGETGILTVGNGSRALKTKKAKRGAEAMDVDEEDAPALSDPTLVDLAAALERADTLVFVLDARDPLAYRSTTIEAFDKKKVFVLTKTDLAPRESVAAWAASLRETLSAPVVLFRAASAFQPAPAPTQSKGKQKAAPTSESDALGADALVSALSSVGAKTIAVVGPSNVGKSALVNSLARQSASQMYDLASSKPGPSTTGRPVSVTVGELTLLDTAGYSPLYADAETEEDERARDILLRSRGRIDRVKDPLPAVNALIPRTPAEDLMLLYNLPAFQSGSTTAFLTAVARARNCLGKNGSPDHVNAARIVLRDWNTGAFAWYTHPSGSSAAGTPTPEDGKVLDACLPRKELRRAKGSLVRLTPGAPDARQIDTHAVLASGALEYGESEVRARAPKRVKVSTDEDDEEEEDDAEMTDGEDDEDEEDEDDEDEDEQMEDKSGYESDNNDNPAPATSKKAKRKEAAAKPKKKVAFASVASYKKIKAGPTRIANAGGAKKAAPANGQAYDFGKFFK